MTLENGQLNVFQQRSHVTVEFLLRQDQHSHERNRDQDQTKRADDRRLPVPHQRRLCRPAQEWGEQHRQRRAGREPSKKTPNEEQAG